MSLLMRAATASLAVALDRLFGEPSRAHPLVGFGRLAGWIEGALNRPARHDAARGLSGAGAMLALVGLPALLLAALPGHPLLDAAVLYFAIGWRSLGEHAHAVAAPLAAGDLPAARSAVARMVSRDCAALDETQIAAATVESVLENGNDAIFGTLFWFALLGGPGALLFRLANTLDAMWGYRSERFNLFGRPAARIDDALNWLPARLSSTVSRRQSRAVPALPR